MRESYGYADFFARASGLNKKSQHQRAGNFVVVVTFGKRGLPFAVSYFLM